MSNARQTGTVRSTWESNGGFCNIIPDDGLEAHLASFADIDDSGITDLEAGQKVSYVAVDTPAGIVARDLKVESDS